MLGVNLAYDGLDKNKSLKTEYLAKINDSIVWREREREKQNEKLPK